MTWSFRPLRWRRRKRTRSKNLPRSASSRSAARYRRSPPSRRRSRRSAASGRCCAGCSARIERRIARLVRARRRGDTVCEQIRLPREQTNKQKPPAGCSAGGNQKDQRAVSLLVPALAPLVAHGVGAFGLRHVPARHAHPENLRGSPGLRGVVVPRAAIPGILELDHGEVGARRRRCRETKRQNANSKYQTSHFQLPVAPVRERSEDARSSSGKPVTATHRAICRSRQEKSSTGGGWRVLRLQVR